MSKVPGLKMSIDEVSQEIDLEDLFGIPLDDRPDIVDAFAQKCIDTILERTESGQGVGGVKLKSPYSQEYSESLLFKAAGKSRSDVNMELTGQMLGTLDVLERDGKKIKLGWDDSTENAKAYNHNTGDTVPKRPFFGLTRDELEEIASEYASEIGRNARQQNSDRSETLTTLAQAFGSELLDLLDD